MQNGICEAFNGRMSDELLNETIFYDLDHTRSTLARWTAAYNQKRPHSALGYLTPAEFAGAFTATGDRLRNPDQLRRSPVAPPALLRQSQPANSSPDWMNVGGQQGSSAFRPTSLSPVLADKGPRRGIRVAHLSPGMQRW